MCHGFRSLGGKHGDSRQVCSRDAFCSQPQFEWDDSCQYEQPAFSMQENDFVPLQDEQGRDLICMENVRQPRDMPGEQGSSLPSIEAFRDPLSDPNLAPIFQNITYDYNSDLIKGQNNLNTIQKIAQYMKSRPNVYIFVEGHCCEKGPQAYNLALGVKRANAVRNLLIKEGVSPDNIFTISYGKERPLVFGDDESAWQYNRRAQFKVYFR